MIVRTIEDAFKAVEDELDYAILNKLDKEYGIESDIYTGYYTVDGYDIVTRFILSKDDYTDGTPLMIKNRLISKIELNRGAYDNINE